MKNINILYTFNDSYFNPAYVSISSLLDHLAKDVIPTIYIIYTSVSEKNLKRLGRLLGRYNGKFVFVNCSEFAKGIKFCKTHHFTSEALYRLYFPLLLENTDRMLYIDPDTLVFDDVSDIYFKTVMRNDQAIACVKHASNDTLNSGVILFNSEVYNSYMPQISEYVEQNFDKLVYQDQDVLNYFFREKYIHLEGKWNQILSSEDECAKLQGILHFAGSDKPWKSYYPFGSFQKLYYKNVCKYDKRWFMDLKKKEFKIKYSKYFKRILKVVLFQK